MTPTLLFILYQRKGVAHGPMHFPQGETLLSVAMR